MYIGPFDNLLSKVSISSFVTTNMTAESFILDYLGKNIDYVTLDKKYSLLW